MICSYLLIRLVVHFHVPGMMNNTLMVWCKAIVSNSRCLFHYPGLSETMAWISNNIYIVFCAIWSTIHPIILSGNLSKLPLRGWCINVYIPQQYVDEIVYPCHKLSLTLSQCTLAGPVYTGMPLECHWLARCTLGYHWATQRILAGYSGTPLETLSWNSPHWNATGETLTFAAYTGTPLEGLWQPTQAPTHIVKHAE